MKIAITGSNGYIGKKLVEYLADKVEVIALYRNNPTNYKHISNVSYKQTDYTLENLKSCFQGCDGIVHLAAQKVKNNEGSGVQGYFPSIMLSENVIRAAYETNIRNIVNISSRCVYGVYTPTFFSENDMLTPINFYGLGKQMIEEMCQYYNDKYLMNIKSLRLGQVLGLDMNDKSMFNTFWTNCLTGQDLTIMGVDIRDYIYISDVCEAILCAVKCKEKKGVFNISMGQGISNVETAHEMIRILKSKSRIAQKVSDKSKTRIVMRNEKAQNELGFSCYFKTMELIINDMIVKSGLKVDL